MNAQPTSTLPELEKLWNFSDPVATEQKFKELLPAAESLGAESYKGELLTQIARTYSLRRMFNEAHETLDIVEQMPLDHYPLVEARYLLERGRTFNSANEKTRARELFLKAWNHCKLEQLDYLAVDAAHMLAIAEHNPDVQIQWNEAAIRYAETAIDPKAMQWLGSLYNNTGWSYHDKGDYQKALKTFEKGLVFRTVNQHPIKTILIAKWCVARANRSLGNIDEALRLQQILKAEYEKHALKSDGYVFEELALLFDLKGDAAAAKEAAQNALNILSADSYFMQNESTRVDKLKALAGLN